MNPLTLGISGIIETVGKIADDLIVTDAERAQLAIEERKLDLDAARIGQATDLAQIEVNKVEAANPSLFVSGWRPGTGWTCLSGLFYSFIAYPMLLWLFVIAKAAGWVPEELPPPPPLDVTYLGVLITGLLGLGGMRTYEKKQGVAR